MLTASLPYPPPPDSSAIAASIAAIDSKTEARQHAVGELEVEGILERQHEVDARVRGHAAANRSVSSARVSASTEAARAR